MQTVKELKGEDKKLYKRLFTCLRPRNEVEVAMSLRYLTWYKLYELSKAEVASGGTVVEGGNGVPYPSPHFSNMVKAEGEMRRLWKQLEPSMIEPSNDTDELGEFAQL